MKKPTARKKIWHDLEIKIGKTEEFLNRNKANYFRDEYILKMTTAARSTVVGKTQDLK